MTFLRWQSVLSAPALIVLALLGLVTCMTDDAGLRMLCLLFGWYSFCVLVLDLMLRMFIRERRILNIVETILLPIILFAFFFG